MTVVQPSLIPFGAHGSSGSNQGNALGGSSNKAGPTAGSVNSESMKALHTTPLQAQIIKPRTKDDWEDYFRGLDKTYPDDKFEKDMIEFGNFAKGNKAEAKAAAGAAIPKNLRQDQIIYIRTALGLSDPYTLPNNSIPVNRVTSGPHHENIVPGSRSGDESGESSPKTSDTKKTRVSKSPLIKRDFFTASDSMKLAVNDRYTIPKAFGEPKVSAFSQEIALVFEKAEDYAFRLSRISNGSDSEGGSLKDALTEAREDFAKALSFYRGADLSKFNSFDKRRMQSTYYNLRSLSFHTPTSLDLLKTLDEHVFGSFRALMRRINQEQYDECGRVIKEANSDSNQGIDETLEVQSKSKAGKGTKKNVKGTRAKNTEPNAISDSSPEEKSLPNKTALEIISGLEEELKRVPQSISKLKKTDVSNLKIRLKETFKDLAELAQNDQFFQSAINDKAKVDLLRSYVVLVINITQENLIDRIFKNKPKAEEVRSQLQEYSKIINPALLAKTEALKPTDKELVGLLQQALSSHFEFKS